MLPTNVASRAGGVASSARRRWPAGRLAGSIAGSETMRSETRLSGTSRSRASIAASSGAAKAFARPLWWTRPARNRCAVLRPAAERDPGWLPLDTCRGGRRAGRRPLAGGRGGHSARPATLARRPCSTPTSVRAKSCSAWPGCASHAVFSEQAATIASGESEPGRALMALAKELDGFVAVSRQVGLFWFDRQSGMIRQLRPPLCCRRRHARRRRRLSRRVLRSRWPSTGAIEAAIAFANVAAALKCRTFQQAPWRPGARQVKALLAETARPQEPGG